MGNFKDRLVNEYKELDIKIIALKEFLKDHNDNLLSAQLTCMETYLCILKIRCEKLGIQL